MRDDLEGRRAMTIIRTARAAAVACIAMQAACAIGQTAPTAPAPSPPPACASADHRAFDFWIGDWTVHAANGKLAGHNSITRRHGGCVLHESYRTPGTYSGESINIYDASRKVWHQTWADSTGLLLTLEGGFRDGRMVLEGAGIDAAGKPIKHRISWSANADGSVRQHWESTDAAGVWSTAFDGKYTRK